VNRKERGELLTLQVDEAFEDLEQQLAQGHTESYLQLLEYYSNFRSYSLGNLILILMQRPSATQCAGYRVWEKLGYQVREGEQALWIRGPQIKKVTDPATGEIEERLIGWLALPVFDVSQLDGEVELPEPRHALEGDFDSLYTLTRVKIAATGVMIDEEPLPQGVHGMSMKGRIVINPTISSAEKCLCAWHEWGHNILDHHNRHDETTKQQRELVAESISFIVARMFGMENPFSRDYITGWKGTVEGLHTNMAEIHSAVKKIMGLLWMEEPARELAEAA
jgi:hypothetical protein